MSELIFDSATLSKLREIHEPMEIRDETGQLVGYFTPSVAPSLYDSLESPVSDEELRRRAQMGGGRTLPEILRDLERRS